MSMVDSHPGVAERLRRARVVQGLAIDDLARGLKCPRAVLEVIERGDWQKLGAPVFAKGLVARYAARLGVEVDLQDVVRSLDEPVLVSQQPVSRMGRFADFSARHIAYVGGTLLVLPLLFKLIGSAGHASWDVRPLDPTPAAGPEAGLAVPTSAAPVRVSGGAASPPSPSVAPVVAAPIPAGTGDASLAPVIPPATVVAGLAGGGAADSGTLELRFTADSWIEVMGRDGEAIERALARGGEARRFGAADVARVTIGNVEATEVRLDGSLVNLDAVRAANVARFALSSDGSIEALAR